MINFQTERTFNTNLYYSASKMFVKKCVFLLFAVVIGLVSAYPSYSVHNIDEYSANYDESMVAANHAQYYPQVKKVYFR